MTNFASHSLLISLHPRTARTSSKFTGSSFEHPMHRRLHLPISKADITSNKMNPQLHRLPGSEGERARRIWVASPRKESQCLLRSRTFFIINCESKFEMHACVPWKASETYLFQKFNHSSKDIDFESKDQICKVETLCQVTAGRLDVGWELVDLKWPVPVSSNPTNLTLHIFDRSILRLTWSSWYMMETPTTNWEEGVLYSHSLIFEDQILEFNENYWGISTSFDQVWSLR